MLKRRWKKNKKCFSVLFAILYYIKIIKLKNKKNLFEIFNQKTVVKNASKKNLTKICVIYLFIWTYFNSKEFKVTEYKYFYIKSYFILNRIYEI